MKKNSFEFYYSLLNKNRPFRVRLKMRPIDALLRKFQDCVEEKILSNGRTGSIKFNYSVRFAFLTWQTLAQTLFVFSHSEREREFVFIFLPNYAREWILFWTCNEQCVAGKGGGSSSGPVSFINLPGRVSRWVEYFLPGEGGGKCVQIFHLSAMCVHKNIVYLENEKRKETCVILITIRGEENRGRD